MKAKVLKLNEKPLKLGHFDLCTLFNKNPVASKKINTLNHAHKNKNSDILTCA